MDGKTKFLVSIVLLTALYGVGVAYYKYIVLKDIQLYYLEEEGEEDLVDEGGEGEVIEESTSEETQESEVADDTPENIDLLDIEATSTATTTLQD